MGLEHLSIGGVPPVCFEDVLRAAARLEGVANATPVLTSRTLDDWTDASVFFKCEGFQRAGAFKFRGAYNAMAQLSAAERRAGVLTYSSGKHAQAVALAGRLLGIATTIVMPDNSPAVKQAATRGYGGEVVLYDPALTLREDLGGGRSQVVIDQYSGKVLQVESSRTAPVGTQVMNFTDPTHVGEVFGLPTLVLVFLGTAALAGQVVTGFLIWWKPGRQSRKGQAGERAA